MVKESKLIKPSFEFDDLEPGISPDEQREGKNRVLQIIAGVFLVLIGIPMIPFVGPGWAVVILGLNLIKPDNAIVRWLRRKIPGIPEEGSLPKRVFVIGGIMFVVSTVVSVLWGTDIFNWVKDLLGF